MQVPFRKMHGTGNKILVVDQRIENLPPPEPEKVRELGKPGSGPGFDQMMWVLAPDDDLSRARYRVFNADGSEVEQCGNGVRCVAKILAEDDGQTPCFSLQGPTGAVEARVRSDGAVSVSMGVPEFEPAAIPFATDVLAKHYTIDVAGTPVTVAAVSMGNPHCVLQVDDIATAPVAEYGPEIERHERFPENANVGFMRVLDRARIDLRVHERGVGETLACGTGACAAVAVGQRLGLLAHEVQVRLPGGQVMVSWRGGDDPVWLTGNAESISEGMMDL